MKSLYILDLEIGNLGALEAFFQELNYDVKVVDAVPVGIGSESSVLILPGVGAFSYASKKISDLTRKNLKEFTNNPKNKLIGICLGMQLLFDDSAETTSSLRPKGFGLIPGHIEPIRDYFKKDINMGWSRLEAQSEFMDAYFSKNCRFYFIHEYFANCSPKYVVAYDAAGIPGFVRKQNIYGLQFHPEKSGTFGRKLIEEILSE